MKGKVKRIFFRLLDAAFGLLIDLLGALLVIFFVIFFMLITMGILVTPIVSAIWVLEVVFK